MNADEILEKLSQEERLELLERLIKGASEAQEEELTLEDRVERLEQMAGPGRMGPVRMMRGRGRKMRGRHMECHCGCD